MLDRNGGHLAGLNALEETFFGLYFIELPIEEEERAVAIGGVALAFEEAETSLLVGRFGLKFDGNELDIGVRQEAVAEAAEIGSDEDKEKEDAEESRWTIFLGGYFSAQ